MSLHLYVGSFNGDGSGQLSVLRLDPANRRLTVIQSVSAADPAYLCLSADGRHLISASETDETAGLYGGAVRTYAFNNDFTLTALSSMRTFGRRTGYVAAAEDGRIVAANYAEGTVSVMHMDAMGNLSFTQTIISRTDLLGHPEVHARPHCVVPTADGSLFVVDAGLSEVVRYSGLKPAVFALPLGSRPRHLVFSADESFAYLVMERTSEVYTLAHRRGAAQPFAIMQILPTLPDDTPGPNLAAAIKIAPDQRSVLVSNRGNDSIAVYERNTATGLLSLRQVIDACDPPFRGGELTKHMQIPGAVPRDVALSPDGTLIAIALQRAGQVSLMEFDALGELQATQIRVDVPNPACVLFGPEATPPARAR
jgi:6-phosphogluconolactonase